MMGVQPNGTRLGEIARMFEEGLLETSGREHIPA